MTVIRAFSSILASDRDLPAREDFARFGQNRGKISYIVDVLINRYKRLQRVQRYIISRAIYFLMERTGIFSPEPEDLWFLIRGDNLPGSSPINANVVPPTILRAIEIPSPRITLALIRSNTDISKLNPLPSLLHR